MDELVTLNFPKDYSTSKYSTVHMAIERRALDGVGDDVPTIRPGTNKWDVLELLVTNPDTGYTRSEIVEATGISENSIGPVLSRLKKADLVENRMGYWFAGSDERVQAIHDAVLSLVASGERMEPEDFSGWRDSSTDE